MAQISDIENMEREIEEMENEEERLAYIRRRIRRFKTITQAVTLAPLLPFVFLFSSVSGVKISEPFQGIARFSVFAIFTAAFLVRLFIEEKIDNFKADEKIILARRRVHNQLPMEEKKPDAELATEGKDDYFERLVKINLENLAAYYELVKVQTDKSFSATLRIAYLGAFFIITGLALGFFRTDAGDKLTYISTGAGVLTEFIAGVFFWLYSRTVSQLRGYHDSLISVQNILLSFKLVSDTRDAKEKAQMVSRMCSYLLAGLPIRPVVDKADTTPKQPKPTSSTKTKPTVEGDATE
jgi:hypothetical protein